MVRNVNNYLGVAVLSLVVGLPLAFAWQTNRATRNFRAVEDGVLYRSGQMTADGLERAIDEHDIRTVISFRDARDPDKPPPDEFETELCQTKKVAYHRIVPLRWSAPDGSVPATANVTRFLNLVKDPTTPRPILVHCFAGVHRTGAYVSLYRIDVNGWNNDEAIREMLSIGEDKPRFESDQLDFLRNYKPPRN